MYIISELSGFAITSIATSLILYLTSLDFRSKPVLETPSRLPSALYHGPSANVQRPPSRPDAPPGPRVVFQGYDGDYRGTRGYEGMIRRSMRYDAVRGLRGGVRGGVRGGGDE